MARIAVYGASGYTGRLVAGALAAAGHAVVAAGRDGARLRAAADHAARRDATSGGAAADHAARRDATSGGAAAAGRPRPAQIAVARLDNPEALAAALEGCDALVNCAGPFLAHGAPVLEAALAARVPYVDTAAEQAWVQRVFERYGTRAAERGVAVVPAAGFDFLPGDLACALAARDLAPLRSLEVAYAVDGFLMSRGTLRSALAGLAAPPLTYDQGAWRPAGAGPLARRVAFPPPFGTRLVAPFPAGEVVTAPRHIETDLVQAVIAARTLTFGIAPLAPLVAPALPLAGAFVRGPVARAADAAIGILPEGPPEGARRRARWIVVADARGRDGRRRRIAVHGRDVYGTTAASAAHAAELLAGAGLAGVLAPAQAFAPEHFLDHLGAARADA